MTRFGRSRSRGRGYLGGVAAPPASGGTFTINPTINSGTISSESGTSYLNARAGDVLTGLFATVLNVGQQYVPADTYNPEKWFCVEGFVDFSLATVTGTLVSATISLGLQGDQSTTDFTVEARTHDYGAALTTADWVAGASLGGKTLLATLPTLGIGADGSYKAMTETGTALRDEVTAAGTGILRMILCSDRQRLGSASTGDEILLFRPYDHVTLKPKLVVVTV